MVGVHNNAVGDDAACDVVVGNDDIQPQRFGARHAFCAADAVVHGNNQIRAFGVGDVGQLGGEPVAVFKAVGHKKIHRRAHARQPFHGNAARGGAVGIIVGNNQDFLLRLDGIGKAAGGGGAVGELGVGDKLFEAGVEFAAVGNVARGVKLGDEWICACRLQGGLKLGINGTGGDAFGVGHGGQSKRSSRSCLKGRNNRRRYFT